MPSLRDTRTGKAEGGGGSALAARRFKNKEVRTDSGESGRVADIMIGEDGRRYAIVDFGADLGRHQIPLESFEIKGDRFLVHERDVEALPQFDERSSGLQLLDPNAMVDIAGYSGTAEDDASILFEQPAPQVTVQRSGLAINWEQAPPQVTVHQPTPHVSVRQPEPEIIVRQPPPRITVEIEQPEIIVRMPEPQVDIAVAEPEVQVSMPAPFVEVVEAGKPQVNVKSGEPVVSLLPRSDADVAIERGQPHVRYESMGEPEVMLKGMNGAPRIRIEEMGRSEPMGLRGEPAGMGGAFERRQEQGRGRAGGGMGEGEMGGEERPLPGIGAAGSAEELIERDQPRRGERTREDYARSGGIELEASELEGRKVYSYGGDEVGSVQRVLIGRDGAPFVVMAHGGILGFLARRILLPASSLAMDGDRILVRDLSVSDIERIEAWDENMEPYEEAARDALVRLGSP